MSLPTVSVVIPTYNQSVLLMQTVQSVRLQTFTDFELIVVDDGSTDDTAARLDEVKRDFPALRMIRQENAGTGAARNRGIAESAGRFVALLDHDDLWLPGKLAAQVEFLDRHPECSMTIVPYATSAAPTMPVFDRKLVAAPDGLVARPYRLAADKVALFMTCSVIMFDRERASGLEFGTTRGAIEDIQFQVRLLARGPLGIAGDQILAIYRVYESNTSRKASYFVNGLRLLRDMDRRGEFSGIVGQSREDMLAWLAFIGRSAAVAALRDGHRRTSLGVYFRELRHQLRDGHLKFATGFPLLAAMPRSVFLSWREGWVRRAISRIHLGSKQRPED